MSKHKCYLRSEHACSKLSMWTEKVMSCDSNMPSTHARRNATFKFEGTERA